MIKFTRENVMEVYKVLTDSTGGTVGVRDEGLLLSAIEAPYQTFGGIDLFPTVLEKGVRLGYGLVSNHPFVDGNKRIGILVMLVFLQLNGINLELTDEMIVDVTLKVASGEYKYEDLLNFIQNNIN